MLVFSSDNLGGYVGPSWQVLEAMLVPLRGSWRLCWPLLEGLGGFPNDNQIRFGGALSAPQKAPKKAQNWSGRSPAWTT